MTDYTGESGGNSDVLPHDSQSLLTEQSNIDKELRNKQKVTLLGYNPMATIVNVPSSREYAAFSVALNESDSPLRKLMFGVLNACYYLYIVTDNYAAKNKGTLKYFRMLFEYMDSSTVTEENCANLFKAYEAWRVSVHCVKTQSTGLKDLKLATRRALAYSDFSSSLTDYQCDYLDQLRRTPCAPDDQVDAVNLSQWFSQHTWLRQEDVGIGHELYVRLGSPKALIASFRLTIATMLLHIQACKDALSAAFEQAGVTACELPYIRPKQKKEIGGESAYRIKQEKAFVFNNLRKKLFPLIDKIPHLRDAIALLVFVHVQPEYRTAITDQFQRNEVINGTSKECVNGFFTSKLDSLFFDMVFLRQLCLAAKDKHRKVKPMPVCGAESCLFSYVMAIQTIPNHDINKITLRNFKFVRRRNGRITHIESNYFKGRAHMVHHVRTIQTKDLIGQALLRYLEDVTAMSNKDIPLACEARLSGMSFNSFNTLGILFSACQENPLKTMLAQCHTSASIAPVFVEAISALLRNGVNPGSIAAKNTHCTTKTANNFFTATHIKTSSVYALSSRFDPTRLSNFNSHSNSTEKCRYLNEHNEEWENLTGRVTRAVMRDLTVNVFCPSEEDKQVFHSDFTHAVEHIKRCSEDVLGVLKVVTEQTSGSVDEIGFVTIGSAAEGDLPDTLYLHDSSHTVMKFLHFLGELQIKHQLLLQRAPEYLFFTALPQAEWMESLLEKNKAKDLQGFSNKNKDEGLKLYQKWRNELPPHFTAQLS